jgi:L-fucose isomerase-like protein
MATTGPSSDRGRAAGSQTTIQVGLVPIVRPLFRGARLGLVETSAQALRDLGARFGFTIAYTAPPIQEIADAHARAAEMEHLRRAGELDLVLIEHVTFATGDLILPLLDLDLPVGLWALPEVTTSGPLPQNALCGLNLSLSLPTSRTMPVKWFYGSATDSQFQDRLSLTLHAMRGVRAIRDARLLWVGGTAPGFLRLDGLPDLPVRIDRAPLDAFFDALAKVSNAEIEARLSTLDEPSSLGREALRPSVRVEVALEHLGRGYDGVAVRCWPELPDRAGAMACGAYARLADRGCPLACEGDAAGLISMLAVAAVTGQPAALLDLSHIERDGLLFWHCGSAARIWAAPSHGTRLAPHFNRGLPAVREMRLAPGPVSGLRFLEGRRAAVYAGTVLDRPDGYDGVSGWFGNLRWAGARVDASGFLASVLNHRLPHHLIWGMGESEAALLELCAWLAHEPLPLDAERTMLRWQTG